MNKNKVIIFLLVPLILVALLTASSLACDGFTQMTGNLHNYPWPIKDVGNSKITKCACNPVDNYLYASVRLQYLDGATYKWRTTVVSNGSDKLYVQAQDSCYDATCNYIYLSGTCYTSNPDGYTIQYAYLDPSDEYYYP